MIATSPDACGPHRHAPSWASVVPGGQSSRYAPGHNGMLHLGSSQQAANLPPAKQSHSGSILFIDELTDE